MSEQMELVKIGNCELSTTGAKLDGSLDFKQWLAVGHQLSDIGACALWWVGDWLVYGRDKFCKKGDDGKWIQTEAYKAAVESVDYDYQTLKTAAYVSSVVALRLPGLTWSHHREVASLKAKDQKRWLGMALEGTDGVRWTVSQLRCAIRGAQAEYKDNEPVVDSFVWAKPATDLFRMLKDEERKSPVDSWTPDYRASVKLCVGKEMQYIHDFYERLCAV